MTYRDPPVDSGDETRSSQQLRCRNLLCLDSKATRCDYSTFAKTKSVKVRSGWTSESTWSSLIISSYPQFSLATSEFSLLAKRSFSHTFLGVVRTTTVARWQTLSAWSESVLEQIAKTMPRLYSVRLVKSWERRATFAHKSASNGIG